MALLAVRQGGGRVDQLVAAATGLEPLATTVDPEALLVLAQLHLVRARYSRDATEAALLRDRASALTTSALAVHVDWPRARAVAAVIESDRGRDRAAELQAALAAAPTIAVELSTELGGWTWPR